MDRVSARAVAWIHSLESSLQIPPSAAQPASPSHVPELAPGTIDHLLARGYLTSLSPSEEEAHYAAQAEALSRRPAPPSFVVAFSQACNLACTYCYQRSGATAVQLSDIPVLSLANIDRLPDAFAALEARQGSSARPRSLTLLGGEPLLARHRPLLARLLDRLDVPTACRVKVITNGLELDAFRDFLVAGRIHQLQVTVDGPREVHDRRRCGPLGQPSFDAILGQVERALQTGVVLNLRINLDAHNFPQLPALAEELLARGFFSYPHFHAYVSPVTLPPSDPGAAACLSPWDLEQAMTALEPGCLALSFLGRPSSRYEQLVTSALRRGHLLHRASSWCAAQSGSAWLLDALGHLYGCWEEAGKPEGRLGRLKEDGSLELDEEKIREKQVLPVLSDPACRRCPLGLFCAGGCSLAHGAGRFKTGHCREQRALFLEAAQRAYGLVQLERQGLEGLLGERGPSRRPGQQARMEREGSIP